MEHLQGVFFLFSLLNILRTVLGNFTCKVKLNLLSRKNSKWHFNLCISTYIAILGFLLIDLLYGTGMLHWDCSAIYNCREGFGSVFRVTSGCEGGQSSLRECVRWSVLALAGLKLYIILPMLVIKVCKCFCKSAVLPLFFNVPQSCTYLSWLLTSVKFKSIQFVVKAITCKFCTVIHL